MLGTVVAKRIWIYLGVWSLVTFAIDHWCHGELGAKMRVSVLLLLRHEMNPKETIIQAIEQLPTSRLPDLLLFIQKLQEETAMEPWAGALMSESSLQKDWLLPEEDEAWQDL
jgi:hypothetical protein